MLAPTVLVPDHRGMPLRRDRNKFRMGHVEFPVIRQYQLERLERPRRCESFHRCRVHAGTMPAKVSVSICRPPQTTGPKVEEKMTRTWHNTDRLSLLQCRAGPWSEPTWASTKVEPYPEANASGDWYNSECARTLRTS